MWLRADQRAGSVVHRGTPWYTVVHHGTWYKRGAPAGAPFLQAKQIGEWWGKRINILYHTAAIPSMNGLLLGLLQRARLAAEAACGFQHHAACAAAPGANSLIAQDAQHAGAFQDGHAAAVRAGPQECCALHGRCLPSGLR